MTARFSLPRCSFALSLCRWYNLGQPTDAVQNPLRALVIPQKPTHLPLSLPRSLLPLITLRLPPLLPLNLRHQSLVLLLILAIPLLLLPQTLPRDEVRIFPELPQRSLPLALVLRFQFAQLGAVAVRVVVAVWIVGFFEFGNRGFDGEGAVVV